MSLRYAYNTNGTASHRLDDALVLMSEAGYDGVALTLDVNHFDPFIPDWEEATDRLAARLRELGLSSVIETGARYLLDPRAKHEPTLVTSSAEGRSNRVAFLKRAIDIGSRLGSEAMSFWAGVPKPGVDHELARAWFIGGVREVVGYAATIGIDAALEPEPGMLIETLDDFAALNIPGLRLALDTGHCLVTGEREPEVALREFAADIATVSIEDMKRGEHIHLAFGDGDMDVRAVLKALAETSFERLVCVELSRDSHRADTMIPAAIRFLRVCEQS